MRSIFKMIAYIRIARFCMIYRSILKRIPTNIVKQVLVYEGSLNITTTLDN